MNTFKKTVLWIFPELDCLFFNQISTVKSGKKRESSGTVVMKYVEYSGVILLAYTRVLHTLSIWGQNLEESKHHNHGRHRHLSLHKHTHATTHTYTSTHVQYTCTQGHGPLPENQLYHYWFVDMAANQYISEFGRPENRKTPSWQVRRSFVIAAVIILDHTLEPNTQTCCFDGAS